MYFNTYNIHSPDLRVWDSLKVCYKTPPIFSILLKTVEDGYRFYTTTGPHCSSKKLRLCVSHAATLVHISVPVRFTLLLVICDMRLLVMLHTYVCHPELILSSHLFTANIFHWDIANVLQKIRSGLKDS
mmetsp:Transcript_17998/g.22866  ORF Transcript_17998/g.22866 Transcript_17998/m.22866 type:complete len:129 (-) Transcript_17998:66-452(-)